MSLDVITVVIPTVAGREALLRRCVTAYQERSAHPVDIAVYADRATCGIVWQEGGQAARGEYIHFTADDLEPHEGWDLAAVAAIEAGHLPAPRVVDPAGTPQYLPNWGTENADGSPVGTSVIPFLSRALWEKVQPLFTGHYYSDNWVTDRAAAAGFPAVLALGYSFTHHWGQPGRGAGMSAEQRMEMDRQAYGLATQMWRDGNWRAPWPTAP